MSQKVKDEVILKIVDTFDECAMIYFDATTNELYENTSVSNYDVERPHSNFYECLIKVVNYFLDGEELDLCEEEIAKQIENKITELKNFLEESSVTNEEVRRAFLLLDIKGFKNVNFPLDFITPDAISLILARLVNFCCSEKDKINLLDFNFGVGNLAFTIVTNSSKDIHLVGIDNHPLMANVSCMKANMMEANLDMYNEDALSMLPTDVDIVVSDIAGYDYENEYYTSPLYDEGVRYFPYLAIEHYLQIKNKVKYLYLIDDDFFIQPGSNKFKEMLRENGSVVSLIALPNSFFLEGSTHKSILVLSNDLSKNHAQTEIFQLPSLKEKESFIKVMNKIEEILK